MYVYVYTEREGEKKKLDGEKEEQGVGEREHFEKGQNLIITVIDTQLKSIY